MNLTKKILIAHHDSQERRRLVMLFAAAGFDIRSFASVEACLEGARADWFDLALVNGEFPGTPSSVLTQGLREIQPTLQLLLMVRRVELGDVVPEIRQGLAGVVVCADDPAAVLRQVQAFFRLEPESAGAALIGGAELAALEAGLGDGDSPARGGDLETRIFQLLRQNHALTAQSARLQEEKASLESELRTLVAQTADTQRLQHELASIRQERELAADAQQAIDQKARALSELRANIASERSALACERQRLERETPARSRTEEELGQIRAELTEWRLRLEQEDDRLASDTVRVRQESLQLARERRRWHEDQELIREQETNLRAHEGRLREMQAGLEAERIRCTAGAAALPRARSAEDERTLREAWAKVERAGEIMEAERKNFLDDRLNLREQEKVLRQREAQLRDRELKLSFREKALVVPEPAPRKASRLARAPAALKSLTRAPMEAVRLALGTTQNP